MNKRAVGIAIIILIILVIGLGIAILIVSGGEKKNTVASVDFDSRKHYRTNTKSRC